MLISIIVPTCKDKQNIGSALDRLEDQSGDYEIIVVEAGDAKETAALLDGRARLVDTPGFGCRAQFNAGAAVARGDVLLFHYLYSRLAADALLAIGRNLKLLPQAVGGNFHLEFDNSNLGARILARLLKWWRYRGSYCSNSGIFIRREVFGAIGGFQTETTMAEFAFVHRMEKYGPTVYLPEALYAPLPHFRQALVWLIGPILVRYKYGNMG